MNCTTRNRRSATTLPAWRPRRRPVASARRPRHPAHRYRPDARRARRRDRRTGRFGHCRALGTVGPAAGRVRIATYGTALVAIVPEAAAALAATYPGLQLEITDTHPPDAIAMLRAGEVDAAIVFRYDATAPDPAGIRLTHLRDDPTYLLTTDDRAEVAQHRDAHWVAGCTRCRSHLVELCARDGFTPHIAYTTDDMVGIQALVAAGMGVATIPGLGLQSHRNPGLNAYKIPDAARHVYAATYGDPPDPPPVAALLEVLTSAPGL